MSVNLKVTLGVVNYLDYVHVTAAKISSPTSIAWETWIDTPVSNYAFIIPGLDPENYYISYYDSPDDVSLGTLITQLVVNALTGETLYERRFYTTDAGGPVDPVTGDSTITDPYLIGKNVTGVFKEAFRYFDPAMEFTFDDTTGIIRVTNGTVFDTGEKFIVEIKYAGASAAPSSGIFLYEGTLNIPELSRTLLASEINSRLRLTGTATSQTITLPALTSISTGNGFYFDNSVVGTAIQPKILVNGTNRIRFNGFRPAGILFSEFWVTAGEHLKLVKYDDSYWEVITDYKGTNVGERFAATHPNHPGTLMEDGAEYSADVYPRLWWWINNVLPVTMYVTDESGTHIANRRGQFLIKPIARVFRMPNTQGLVDKGLLDFVTYGSGSDVNRPYNYPGGIQNEAIGDHIHQDIEGDSGSHGAATSALSGLWRWMVGFGDTAHGTATNSKTGAVTRSPGDLTKNTVDNNGVIFLRRI